MASNDFTGTASTQISTYDATWVSCAVSGHDGSTDLNLDGSGNLRTGSFKYSDAVRTDGDQNSKSRIVVAAGNYAPGSCEIRAAVRRTTTTDGYSVRLRSSTNLASNIDSLYVYRQNVFMSGLSITPIDNTSTALDLQVVVTNTVDVQCIINGQTVTATGSGGNDASGAAVLTGGNPGLSILLNSSTLTFGLIDSWTDDAAGGSSAPRTLTLLGVG